MSQTPTRGLGIDVGGTGIKGAVVDLSDGELALDRVRIPTPHPSTPEAVAEVVAEVVDSFDHDGPVGVTLPCVVKDGVSYLAANLDDAWVGCDARALFSRRLGRRAVVVNDADAAGKAEMTFGAGAGRTGVVLLVTFGTGIGTALFHDGKLLPNSELGHLELHGVDAEELAAASVKTEGGTEMSWREWSGRVSTYLQHVEMLLSPDLIIAGGGVSRDAEQWLHMVECSAELIAAQLRNNAGIVGAALAAERGVVTEPR